MRCMPCIVSHASQSPGSREVTTAEEYGISSISADGDNEVWEQITNPPGSPCLAAYETLTHCDVLGSLYRNGRHVVAGKVGCVYLDAGDDAWNP